MSNMNNIKFWPCVRLAPSFASRHILKPFFFISLHVTDKYSTCCVAIICFLPNCVLKKSMGNKNRNVPMFKLCLYKVCIWIFNHLVPACGPGSLNLAIFSSVTQTEALVKKFTHRELIRAIQDYVQGQNVKICFIVVTISICTIGMTWLITL